MMSHDNSSSVVLRPQDASGGGWRFSILAYNGDFLYSWVLSLDPILDLHSDLGSKMHIADSTNEKMIKHDNK